MEAFRYTYTVKDHKISITLPNDFDEKEVEVIIFPVKKETDWYDELSEEEKNTISKSQESHKSGKTLSNKEAQEKTNNFIDSKRK